MGVCRMSGEVSAPILCVHVFFDSKMKKNSLGEFGIGL